MSAQSPRSADELLEAAVAAIDRATEEDTPEAVNAMRLLAAHLEDLTSMFLDRIEDDIPYQLASDEGLAAWQLAEVLRYTRSAELAGHAAACLGDIAEAAGSRDVRTLRELETALAQ